MDVKAGILSVNPSSEPSPICSKTGLIKIEMVAFTSQRVSTYIQLCYNTNN